MPKTVLYSWHLDPDLKRSLQIAARAEKTSVGRPLDRIVREWLDRWEAEEEALQQKLRAEFLKGHNQFGRTRRGCAGERAVHKTAHTRAHSGSPYREAEAALRA